MFFCFFTFITPVFAQGEDYGLSFTAEQASLAANPNLPHLIGGILGTVLSLVGILFFALMLYGGITWMTARGAADQEKKALSTITAAIIGILIVLGSYAITQFVFKAIQGTGGNSAPNDSSTGKKCSGKTEADLIKYCNGFAKDKCATDVMGGVCEVSGEECGLVNDAVTSIQSLCTSLKEELKCDKTICNWQ